MKLIADGGSTKTEWCLCSGGRLVKRVFTGGMNPYILDDDEILRLLRSSLLPNTDNGVITEIHYYGAGCRDAVIPRVRGLLEEVFADAGGSINVYTDMLGAARALLGREAGIACILGTGSNSCYYDGSDITEAVPPMGYILGDEGSGAAIGKALVNAMFKRRMPEDLREMFGAETGLTADEVIRRTYRGAEPGRFLASLTHFTAEHIARPEIDALVTECLRKFFTNNIAAYGRRDCPIAAMGSIAYYFNEQLQRAAAQEGYEISRITRSPMDGMLAYHGIETEKTEKI